jgi:ubiquinone/menaquinone biosynthesis C-methylase UbiE
MPAYEGFGALEKSGWANDATASGYVNLFSSASDLAIPKLIAGIDPGAGVLDLCCGQGNVSEALLAGGFQVMGADFSPTMLAYARERVPTGEFVEADAQDLPFADGDFDAVVCNFGIPHIPDQPRALAQVRRVLRSGGQFAMTSWCGPDVSPTFQVFYSSVQEHGDPHVAMPEGPNFHQFADETMARALLADAGFSQESHEQIDCYWTLASPNELAEIFQQGAPRGGYLLTQQPDHSRAAIKTAIAAKVRERFAQGDEWHVPIPAALVTATAI